MPSHLIHGALVQMHYDLDGAPWNFVTWKVLTDVHHGLFPEDDNLLPDGWSRQTADEISSFFDQFRTCMTEEEKINFSSVKKKGQNIPGRKAWRDWVNKIWKNRRIHNKITEVLSSENLHPYTLAVQSGSSDTWPSANMWVPLAIDPVALALFGEECYSDGVERVRASLRNSTGALITRTWLVLYNGLNRTKKRIDVLESAAIQAFEDLDRDGLTKAKLRVVVDKVVKWKQVVETLHTVEGEKKIEDMESELGRLMVGLDSKVKPTSNKKSKSLCRVTAQMLQSLASVEDVADIINLYSECFNPLAGDSSQLEDQVASVSLKFGTNSDGTDPGTEVESTMTPSHLSQKLGFVNNLPILFNTHRHVGGVTPWDDSAAFRNLDRLKSSEDFTPNELHWHQLAGVHAILRRLLSEEPSRARPGILIADEVGLGKTLQSLATIAWLTECAGRQWNEVDSPLPPILTERPYLGESDTIPDDCHLILVPGTVLNQWASEIRIFLNPKAFDLFLYQTGADFRENFWSESGPFAQSNQPPSNKIILAPHSALSQEFNLLYMLPKSSAKELPWRKPLQVPAYNSIVQKTLFGLDLLSVTMDEAHEFRNAGAKHSSALAILQNAKIRMIMTATPLQTSTKDLAGMGRLVGIDFFFSQKAFDEEKADLKELRRAKAALGEDFDPLSVEENADNPIRETQAVIALRIQGQFEQRVLRRIIDSKNWLGESLVELPELHEYTVLLKLQPFEQEIHSKLAERLRDELSSCTTAKAFSSSFYLPSRLGATYPRLSLSEKIPRFKTREEWESRKSTKVDTCARMCCHLTSRDDAPSMIFQDGTVIFPEVPKPMPGELVTYEKKIVIFEEFPSFGPMVRDVFSHYNIRYLYMDGQASYAARAKMVHTFNTDPTIRVLIFTSVGASGLNLTKASIVIFLDQPWSAQDVRQIRGRIYRQGQTKKVYCYHLLADGTSDMIIAALAGGKKNMMESFLQQPQGNEMLRLMTQGVGPSEEDYLDDNERRRLENERALDAPKAKLRKKNDAESSTKPKKTSKPNPKEKSQTDSIIDLAAPISNVQESSSETGGPTPQTRKVVRPKPKPRGKNANVPESSTKKPEPNPEGNKMEKSQTHLLDCNRTDVDKATTSQSPPTTFTPRIQDQYTPKTPRVAEVGQRRGRPQYRPEPDSPEGQKATKRARMELVSYESSPEKPATNGPDSDAEMSDNRRGASLGAQSQGNHRRADIEMLDHTETTLCHQHERNREGRLADAFMFRSQPANSLQPSFSTSNRKRTLSIEPEDFGNREPCGSETMLGANIRAQGKGIQDEHPAAMSMSKIRRINSLTDSFSTAGISDDIEVEQYLNGGQLKHKAQTMVGANLRADNPNLRVYNSTVTASLSLVPPVSSASFPPSAISQRSFGEGDIEDLDRTQELRGRMKSMLKGAKKPMNEEEKAKYNRLHDFKIKLVGEKVSHSAAGPSSVTRRQRTPDIRQPSILGQPDRLSPPPRATPSQNPFSRNSLKKQKSRWE